jgi:hypothetical protein
MTTDEDRQRAQADGLETAPSITEAVGMLFDLTDEQISP